MDRKEQIHYISTRLQELEELTNLTLQQRFQVVSKYLQSILTQFAVQYGYHRGLCTILCLCFDHLRTYTESIEEDHQMIHQLANMMSILLPCSPQVCITVQQEMTRRLQTDQVGSYPTAWACHGQLINAFDKGNELCQPRMQAVIAEELLREFLPIRLLASTENSTLNQLQSIFENGYEHQAVDLLCNHLPDEGEDAVWCVIYLWRYDIEKAMIYGERISQRIDQGIYSASDRVVVSLLAFLIITHILQLDCYILSPKHLFKEISADSNIILTKLDSAIVSECTKRISSWSLTTASHYAMQGHVRHVVSKLCKLSTVAERDSCLEKIFAASVSSTDKVATMWKAKLEIRENLMQAASRNFLPKYIVQLFTQTSSPQTHSDEHKLKQELQLFIIDCLLTEILNTRCSSPVLMEMRKSANAGLRDSRDYAAELSIRTSSVLDHLSLNSLKSGVLPKLIPGEVEEERISHFHNRIQQLFQLLSTQLSSPMEKHIERSLYFRFFVDAQTFSSFSNICNAFAGVEDITELARSDYSHTRKPSAYSQRIRSAVMVIWAYVCSEMASKSLYILEKLETERATFGEDIDSILHRLVFWTGRLGIVGCYGYPKVDIQRIQIKSFSRASKLSPSRTADAISLYLPPENVHDNLRSMYNRLLKCTDNLLRRPGSDTVMSWPSRFEEARMNLHTMFRKSIHISSSQKEADTQSISTVCISGLDPGFQLFHWICFGGVQQISREVNPKSTDAPTEATLSPLGMMAMNCDTNEQTFPSPKKTIHQQLRVLQLAKGFARKARPSSAIPWLPTDGNEAPVRSLATAAREDRKKKAAKIVIPKMPVDIPSEGKEKGRRDAILSVLHLPKNRTNQELPIPGVKSIEEVPSEFECPVRALRYPHHSSEGKFRPNRVRIAVLGTHGHIPMVSGKFKNTSRSPDSNEEKEKSIPPAVDQNPEVELDVVTTGPELHFPEKILTCEEKPHSGMVNEVIPPESLSQNAAMQTEELGNLAKLNVDRQFKQFIWTNLSKTTLGNCTGTGSKKQFLTMEEETLSDVISVEEFEQDMIVHEIPRTKSISESIVSEGDDLSISSTEDSEIANLERKSWHKSSFRVKPDSLGTLAGQVTEIGKTIKEIEGRATSISEGFTQSEKIMSKLEKLKNEIITADHERFVASLDNILEQSTKSDTISVEPALDQETVGVRSIVLRQVMEEAVSARFILTMLEKRLASG